MAKGPGIVGLIFGIIALTPLPIFSAVFVTDTNPALAPFLLFVPSIIAIVFGIIGVAVAKEDKKVPGILGIVFGAVGLLLNNSLYALMLVPLMMCLCCSQRR